jgi:hypothetical protein
MVGKPLQKPTSTFLKSVGFPKIKMKQFETSMRYQTTSDQCSKTQQTGTNLLEIGKAMMVYLNNNSEIIFCGGL